MWGVGKADVLRERGRLGLRRRPRPRRRGRPGRRRHQRLGAHRRLHPRASCSTAGTHVVLDSPRRVPGLARRARPRPAARRPRGAAARARLRAGRLQRRRRQCAAARRRRAHPRAPTTSSPATGYSDSLPAVERDPARDFATSLGVELLTPRTHEMEREGYRANSGERCYFCKAELIETLRPLADERGIAHVATGTNADDAVAGFRPGIRAAAERGAVTPLLDAGLTKDDVRRASRRWGLPTWDKPAAACLSSRVAYGIEVTPHRLARVERAEAGGPRRAGRRRPREPRPAGARPGGAGLRSRSTRDLLARPAVRGRPGRADAVLAAVVAAGFDEAELDPRGFRSGSLNEALADGLSASRLAGCPSAPIVCARARRPPSPATIDTRSRNEEVKTVPSGKVKWFDADKGFGFLSQDGGPDVYVHADALPDGHDHAQDRHPRRVRHRPGPSRRPGAPGPGPRRAGVGRRATSATPSARTPS